MNCPYCKCPSNDERLFVYCNCCRQYKSLENKIEYFWGVSVWPAEVTRIPIEGVSFKTQQEAEEWADIKREEIKKKGLDWVVTVNEGVKLP